MRHLKIKTTDDEHVHFDLDNSATLCGMETGDDDTVGIEAGRETRERVDCPQCIQLVLICKTVKFSEMRHE